MKSPKFHLKVVPGDCHFRHGLPDLLLQLRPLKGSVQIVQRCLKQRKFITQEKHQEQPTRFATPRSEFPFLGFVDFPFFGGIMS